MNEAIEQTDIQIPPINLGIYFLVLLDQLGQTEELFKWNDFELLKHEESEANAAFFRSIKSTVTIRTDFRGLFNGFERQLVDSVLLKRLEAKYPGKTKDIELARGEIVNGQAFSDTHLWYTRSIGNSAVFNCQQLLSMFDATALTFLFALARGEACRGAITLGCGTDVLRVFSKGPSEIYGPVLAEAHNLETKVAQYPRVVISDGIWDYLTIRYADTSSHAEIDQVFVNQVFENSHIDQIRDMIFSDDDGVWALDYAGQKSAIKLRKVIDTHTPNSIVLFQQAIDFAKNERDRFAKARNQQVLTDRYAKLFRYLDSRKKFWQ